MGDLFRHALSSLVTRVPLFIRAGIDVGYTRARNKLSLAARDGSSSAAGGSNDKPNEI
jgi:hypothetical protein